MSGEVKAGSGCESGPEAGDVLQGRFRYQLERRLGEGGFGSVFLARCLDASPQRDQAPPEEVAVKILGPTHDRSARSFLKRELAALLAVQHDRIPQVYDWSLDTERAFFALQYFPSGSLADARSFIRHLDEQQTWRLISDLLSALAAAHRASILHLDVKPSNVLLDGNGGYVLTDFGVSHASRMSKGLLDQGQIAIGLGTHGYRAPEQASASIQSFDLRTDLWGVGVTAWSMYTGIDLNKRQDVLRSREAGNFYGLEQLSDVRLHCPAALDQVVMSMLAIDPGARPGGAAEVLSQVRALTGGMTLGSPTKASDHPNPAHESEARAVIESLADPLWASICRAPGFERFLTKFEDGEVMASAGEQSHNALLLLRGEVGLERDGKLVGSEDLEGTLLCAISTLTAAERGVTLRARGDVWICTFNEAELEQLLTCNPAVALRMIRMLANRIVEGPPRHCD